MPDCFLHPLPYQEDPGERFALIHRAPGAVLLDAGRPIATRGRYDLLSAWPLAELAPLAGESANRFFARVRSALQSLGEARVPDTVDVPFVGGMIGYLGYDFGRHIEHLPEPNLDDLALPDARLGLYAWALLTDHEERSSRLVFHPALAAGERERLIRLFEAAHDGDALPPFRLGAPFRPDLSRDQYREALERVHNYILAGDCYQVNYTQRFRAPCSGSPWLAYRALREACPTPFAGYLALPEGAVLSLSPERFIQLHGNQVETRPIKGTRPRGNTPEADRNNAEALLASEKDRAENLMIVDLLRNDLGRSCRPGSVRVPELFAVETYPNVHHLVSSVRGELAADKDALDLLEGSFPGGSITGAPKVRAMQIIDELEPTQRSIYCGSLLYLDVRGEMDSSIAIRTVLVKDGQASCWAGGGIVADSNWEEEYEESLTKVGVLLRTLESL
ncbi:aminodeoxychorismate synthase component I [Pseudomonas nitroreducens]|uniref:aminodeoxychorismate synthase component I n=1 Tax=Pseudomonas nitroreducens TaxID=46680 RepID=UPI001472FA20|nr:aminodeoxychorismate synthase component I [Pseudomonas nitroreducens]MDG9856256.1 aminodeoxychorismate synthase component I [Pseudomonas nitroreducens]MDH1075650.1 aminodeoxychorismate synthase component I [Pseudomonas nitroreducens]NMZ74151.1 aminodeoxychorismate synthase component I [Pseudomonas nitroreducens]